MRKVYLSNTPRAEALEQFLNSVSIPVQKELINVSSALGRISAGPVFARHSMPGYHASAMDGIAVRAEHTFKASDQNPLLLKPEHDYVNVNTGEPLPPGFDAVIKVEEIQVMEDNSVEIINPATPWQHVRPVGEDVVAGELIVTTYHCLRPPDLGALLAGGITEIEVLSRPKAAVIASGTEIVDPGAKREIGSVPDFNSRVVSSYLEQWGAETLSLTRVPDDPEIINRALRDAVEKCDLVIIIAGSSAGEKDFTFQAMEKLGKVFLHGVATRPGKPTILGEINCTPVIGLPGYPLSAYLSLEWFVRPLILRHLGQTLPEREKLKVTLGRRIVSETGVEEFIHMTVGYVNATFIANPLSRGAGVTMSLVRADGLLTIPANTVGYEQDEVVEIELYRSKEELHNNLLTAGSHDLILDLLATALKKRGSLLNLSSAHLGSMGGIVAVGRGQAHLAGTHLFDPESGDYNRPYIKKILPGRDLRLINLAYRMQGWIVPGGNPDRIESIRTLADEKISFVNRQKGAGTRLLFDHMLREENIKPDQIFGYQREEFTHLNVAAAVSAGTARAGLGILPAAKAFELDFIPVTEERYDLLVSETFYSSRECKELLKIITDPGFQQEVENLGGYSMRDAGSIIEID